MLKKLIKNMSLRTKILIILLFLTLSFSSFSLILVQSIEDISKVSNQIKQTNIPELFALSELEEELHVKEHIIQRAIEQDMCCQFVKDYLSYYSPAVNEIVDQPPDSVENYKKRVELLDFMIVNNVQGLLSYSDNTAAVEFIQNHYLPQLYSLKAEIKEAKKESYTALNGNSSTFSEIIKGALWLLVFLTTGAICLSIIVSYRFSASLTKPVETMISKVDLIANGEYGLTLQPGNQLELQHLAHSINQMSKRLKESFQTIINDKIYREQILNSLSVGIITINGSDLDITMNNSARKLLNKTESEVKKLATNDVLDHKEEFWSIIASKKMCKHKKVPFQTPNGLRYFLVSQTELINQNHQVIGRIVNFIDITDTEKLEKRIHQSEKLAAVGEMAAGAAHEIRNPLAVVQGFLSLMNQELTDHKRNQYHLPLIMNEIERINGIIEEMMFLSRPGMPDKSKAYIEDILAEFLPLIMKSSEQIEFEIVLERLSVEVDVKQIKQVFHNLIRNSIEAMDGKGTINIFSKVSEKFYCIYIKDCGPGIPHYIRDMVFEPFSSSKENGTGLGLMIVKRIIENHKGNVEILDTSENGTTFLLQLPLAIK